MKLVLQMCFCHKAFNWKTMTTDQKGYMQTDQTKQKQMKSTQL